MFSIIMIGLGSNRIGGPQTNRQGSAGSDESHKAPHPPERDDAAALRRDLDTPVIAVFEVQRRQLWHRLRRGDITTGILQLGGPENSALIAASADL